MRLVNETSSSSRPILKSHEQLPRRRRRILPQLQNLQKQNISFGIFPSPR
jgi:hypothetical protein